MRPRVAGMLPPGSPATISARTDEARQVDALLARRLGQPQGVGRRTQHDGRLVVAQEAQAGAAAHAAAGQAEAAVPPRRVEGRPEAEERPEREREEEPIARPHAGHAINGRPVVEHPGPAFRRVEPAQRSAGRAGSLAQAAVALDRVGERRAVGRMLRLVGQQLRLGGERQPGEVGRRDHAGWIDAGRRELAGVEAVGRQGLAEQSGQALALPGGRVLRGSVCPAARRSFPDLVAEDQFLIAQVELAVADRPDAPTPCRPACDAPNASAAGSGPTPCKPSGEASSSAASPSAVRRTDRPSALITDPVGSAADFHRTDPVSKSRHSQVRRSWLPYRHLSTSTTPPCGLAISFWA